MSDHLTIQEQRRRDTYALLRSLLDCYPGPKTWTGTLVASSARRGEIATKTRNCEKCGGSNGKDAGPGSGWLKRGAMKLPCLDCGGVPVHLDERDNRIPAVKGRGWFLVDAVTLKPVPSELMSMEQVLKATASSVRCDGCYKGVGPYRRDEETGEVTNRCRYCNGSGQRPVWPLGIPTDEGAAKHWLVRSAEKQARLDERGSYRELRAALEFLYREHERRARAVWRYVVCDPDETFWTLPGYTRAWLDETVDMIAARMPAKIRVPIEHTKTRAAKGKGRWANGHMQADLHNRVRELRASGLSVRAVAEQIGLGKSQVQRITAVASQR